MYAGQVVEYGAVPAVFSRPLHPYTAGLQASLPRLGVVQERLRVIPGNVPNPARFPAGCRFHPRCGVRIPKCLEPPPLDSFHDRLSRCWRSGEIEAGALDPVAQEAAR
jgi:oligopeptide/dipeptide ABC transporter ATP-binding protein